MKRYIPGITVVLAALMVASYFPSVQEVLREGVAWADSKVSALTQKTTPPNPQTDWVYFIDMSESVAASRSKKINVQDLIRPKTVWVNHPNQFVTVGGESIYQVDPALGNVFMIDTTSIYLSGTTFDAVSGITVMLPPPSSGNSNVQVEIRKADSGITPVQVWAYSANGITFQRIWNDMSTEKRSGVSVWDVDNQGDVRAYRLCPDPESEVSAWPTFKIIQ